MCSEGIYFSGFYVFIIFIELIGDNKYITTKTTRVSSKGKMDEIFVTMGNKTTKDTTEET